MNQVRPCHDANVDDVPIIRRARFDDLSPRDLYDILRLRSAVFVVEQECVFLDLDGRDHEASAQHLWIRDDVGVAATVRLLDEGDGVCSIGRVVTRPDARSRGTGARLMAEAISMLEAEGCTSMIIGAQARLAGWYGGFGFVVVGPDYVEDGILHVPMRRVCS